MILVPRQSARRPRPFLRALVATLLALVGHALMAWLLVSLPEVQGPQRTHRPQAPRAVTLRGLSAEQWAENRGLTPPHVKDERTAVAKKPRPEEAKRKPEPPPGQVVDVAPGNGQENPDAKYAAETSNTVKQETKAKEQTPFYRNAAARRTSPHPDATVAGPDETDQAQRAGNDGVGDDDRPYADRLSKPALEVPDIKRRTEVAMRLPAAPGPGAQVSNRTETTEVKGNSARFKVALGPPSEEDGAAGRAGAAGQLNLLPSPSVFDRVSGAAANDHLADVDEGDGTYLNTREWRYASFFNRVKQSVGQQWHPQHQLRLRDPTMQVYGSRDRYTVVQVTLSPDGKLRDVFVEKSCGLDFLDLEAIKAFERAQPFPNPPPGLLASDQTVHFQFGFFLEMSGRPGLRLFRSTE